MTWLERGEIQVLVCLTMLEVLMDFGQLCGSVGWLSTELDRI